MKNSAANVVRETWLIYKNTVLGLIYKNTEVLVRLGSSIRTPWCS